METTAKNKIITVQAEINVPVKKVWEYWTDPKHIIHWNNASEDWHTPIAENDLHVGGRFMSRMEAKDGSIGFDFTGEYTKIFQYKEIEYVIDDGRKVSITFTSDDSNKTIVSESFEAEQMNSPEVQHEGWQSILNNFKKYVETSNKETLHFEILIDAPVEKVYKVMLDEKTYNEWTTVFNPSSHFRGSWEKGSKILFIGTDSTGNTGGMVSRIKENIPNKFVSIEHLGMYKDGYEITSGEEVESWAGALENYTFSSDNGKTLLSIDVDVTDEYKKYMLDTWPEALEKLKELCEKD